MHSQIVTKIRLFLLACIVHASMSVHVYVNTTYGRVRGKQTSEAKAFLGIPYASPPKRWEYAREPIPWHGIWDATRVKPMCFQPACADTDPPGVCQSRMSEDCLYLNVFVPMDSSPGGNKSVLLFIHGGAFTSYSGGAEIYNGERFVNKGDVILVTINYRLGAFGFLVTGNTPNSARGNYGIADQRLAMLWVRRNINRFGGDPNKITIFGQSAGAVSVGIHLTSRKSDHLFQQAITQSLPFIKLKTFNQAKQQGEQFANRADCRQNVMQCLRQKSPEEIIEAQQKTKISFGFIQRFLLWGPHLDGDQVPLSLMQAFELGNFGNKPIMLGNTADEGIGYIYGAFRAAVNGGLFSVTLNLITHRYAPHVFNLYRPKDMSDVREEFSELATDYVFICPARKVARHLMQYTNTWMYVFDHNLNFLNKTRYLKDCLNYACHGSELPYLFQTPHRAGFNLTFEDMQLSDELLIYWTNFAKYGNPNGNQTSSNEETTPEAMWPRYQGPRGGRRMYANMVFRQPNSRIEFDYHGHVCDFWDRTGYRIN